jgi:L-malate glycosyltransferase
MKVMVVPSWYPTPDNPLNGTFFKEQSLSLQKYGYDVTVLYPEVRTVRMLKQQNPKKGITAANEDGLKTYRKIVYNFIPGRVPFATGYYYYQALKKLYKTAVENEGRPDLIHAHSCLWGGWAAAKIAEEENIPLILTEHSSSFIRGLLKPYEKKEIAKTLKAAKYIISVGPSLKRELEKYTDKQIYEIPNIVNIDDFSLDDESGYDPSRKFRFLSVAHLTRNKGMDVLINSFTKAFKGKNAELYIGGDGIERENLVRLTKELDVNDQVVFLGALNREQVKNEMRRCDVFVLASRFETFGVVLIEALATGKPVISTRCGGPEAIVNQKNGLLVQVDNIEELSQSLVQMKENYHLYNPLELRKDCIERFSEKVIINKISELYLSRQ